MSGRRICTGSKKVCRRRSVPENRHGRSRAEEHGMRRTTKRSVRPRSGAHEIRQTPDGSRNAFEAPSAHAFGSALRRTLPTLSGRPRSFQPRRRKKLLPRTASGTRRQACAFRRPHRRGRNGEGGKSMAPKREKSNKKGFPLCGRSRKGKALFLFM